MNLDKFLLIAFTVLLPTGALAEEKTVINLSTFPACNTQSESNADTIDKVLKQGKRQRLLNAVEGIKEECKLQGALKVTDASEDDLKNESATVLCSYPPEKGSPFSRFGMRMFSFASDGHLLTKSGTDEKTKCAFVISFSEESGWAKSDLKKIPICESNSPDKANKDIVKRIKLRSNEERYTFYARMFEKKCKEDSPASTYSSVVSDGILITKCNDEKQYFMVDKKDGHMRSESRHHIKNSNDPCWSYYSFENEAHWYSTGDK